jgi:hypothetical protein
MTLKNINTSNKNIILASCLPAEAFIKVLAFITACIYLAWVFLTNYPARNIDSVKLSETVKKIGRYSFKWSLSDEDNWPIIKRMVKSHLF